jgi:hypothetical protein
MCAIVDLRRARSSGYSECSAVAHDVATEAPRRAERSFNDYRRDSREHGRRRFFLLWRLVLRVLEWLEWLCGPALLHARYVDNARSGRPWLREC